MTTKLLPETNQGLLPTLIAALPADEALAIRGDLASINLSVQSINKKLETFSGRLAKLAASVSRRRTTAIILKGITLLGGVVSFGPLSVFVQSSAS